MPSVPGSIRSSRTRPGLSARITRDSPTHFDAPLLYREAETGAAREARPLPEEVETWSGSIPLPSSDTGRAT